MARSCRSLQVSLTQTPTLHKFKAVLQEQAPALAFLDTALSPATHLPGWASSLIHIGM